MRKALTLLLFSLTACGGGGGGSTTGPNGNTTGGTFTATVDGQSWVSTTNQTTGGGSGANAVPGTIALTGTKVITATNYTTITILLGYISGTGTYPLGVNQGTTAGGSAIVNAPQGASYGSWSTNLSGAAGLVTITSLTSTRIIGTFQFNAPPQSFTQTTGTRVVTNGAFDLPLPANFALAPATNKGSKVSATIGGVAWNAASVVALGANGVFGISASTDSLSVSLLTGKPVSAGSSYAIGGTGGGSMTVIKTGTSFVWTSGTGSAAVGTFTITSMSATRATGTFSATLVPGIGTPASLLIAGGTFDVRIDSP